jgi:nucleoside-diphosphate-sugar epimerase
MNMAKTRILLTGANSLTGSHILSQLLSQGTFSVRAVVDSREAAYALQHLYPRIAPGSLDLAIVLAQDASTPRVFEAALSDHSRPFDVVIHTLSPTPYGVADCLAKVINLETEKTSNFLKSVQQVARAVRRVVIVTSLTPFARWLVDPLGQVDRSVPGGTDYTSSSRVPNSEYILATSQASDNIVYDAVSRWTREASITFDVVYLTAPSIYGPAIRSLASSSDISESNRRIWNICCNESAENSRMPPYGISKFLDVRVSHT